MIEQRSPIGAVDLLLRHTGQSIIGRPAIKEVTILAQSFAERPQKPAGHEWFAQHCADGQQLVTAIAAVLLTFAPHPVNGRFNRGIVDCVDRRVKQFLESRVRTAGNWLMLPRIHAASHAHVANRDRRVGSPYMQLQPAQGLIVKRLEAIHSLAADKACPSVEMIIEPGCGLRIVRLLGH